MNDIEAVLEQLRYLATLYLPDSPSQAALIGASKLIVESRELAEIRAIDAANFERQRDDARTRVEGLQREGDRMQVENAKLRQECAAFEDAFEKAQEQFHEALRVIDDRNTIWEPSSWFSEKEIAIAQAQQRRSPKQNVWKQIDALGFIGRIRFSMAGDADSASSNSPRTFTLTEAQMGELAADAFTRGFDVAQSQFAQEGKV